MDGPQFRLLSELSKVDDYLDDPVFTDVTASGEKYTTFRVVRVTHEVTDHPDGWTHVANVALERSVGIGTALLMIIDRAIEDSKVSMADPNG